MYTIKTVAARTGVPATTIRAWERRYGVVAPERTSGGYRAYSDRDLRAITRMAELIEQGLAANQAADRVRDEEAPSVLPPPEPPAPGEAGRELVRAAAALDTAAMRAELERAFAAGSFEQVVDGWLRPALRDVGVAWAEGRLDVSGEHFLSQAIRGRLLLALALTSLRPDAPRIVVAQAAGVQHDLGLLAFAVAAQRRGLDVRFIGADVPVDDVLVALRAADAACLVLSVPQRDDLAQARHLVARVAASAPSTLVAAGGSFQDDLPDTVLKLGHDLGPAARLLAQRLIPDGETGTPAG